MTIWYSKKIGDGIEAQLSTKEIQDSFSLLFIKAGQPKEMAVFSRYDLEANVVTVYFTPAAKTLALKFDATSCNMPSKDGRLGLIAGYQSAVDFYYGGS